MARLRDAQLAYSELQAATHDERKRRRKAAKVVAVLRHALGRDRFDGLSALDVGCSTGFIAEALASAGARTIGVDIDEPGIEKARARFGDRVEFRLAGGENLPVEPGSLDIVVFNQIYEHVVDPEAVVANLVSVLKPGGVAYLGLGNRLGIMEPHYRLPFLSWLPQPAADAYMRLAGKGDEYYETFRTRRGLRSLFAELDLWDYTLPILTEPSAFAGEDVVPAWVRSVPSPLLRTAMPLVPTYVWVGFKGASRPAGGVLGVAPQHL